MTLSRIEFDGGALPVWGCWWWGCEDRVGMERPSEDGSCPPEGLRTSGIGCCIVTSGPNTVAAASNVGPGGLAAMSTKEEPFG